jgi:hypothetical protein
MDVKQLLNSSKVADRKKAAKRIEKDGRIDLLPDLIVALEKELENPKKWESQGIMINVLGNLKASNALAIVQDLCSQNKEHDLVTIFAARAFVRIRKENNNDIRPINELLGIGGYSIVSGAFMAIGEDKMIFKNDEIAALLDFAENYPKKWVRGTMDIRNGLAQAAINWPFEIIENFINGCVSQTDDPTLANTAKKVLATH